MSSIAIILLLLSALTHAGWNYISKRAHPTLSFYLVANLFGTLCVLPILFYFRSLIGMVPAIVWCYVTNIGYVAIFRQLSIPLGALFGILLLKESRHLPKVFGIAIIFAGLVLVVIG